MCRCTTFGSLEGGGTKFVAEEVTGCDKDESCWATLSMSLLK